MDTADRIKQLTEQKGNRISLNALEKELGFGQYTISIWKKCSPTASRLVKVAEYFGVSVDYLLGRTEVREVIGKGWTEEATNEFRLCIEQIKRKYGIESEDHGYGTAERE